MTETVRKHFRIFRPSEGLVRYEKYEGSLDPVLSDRRTDRPKGNGSLS
jgi:hypothetical protein